MSSDLSYINRYLSDLRAEEFSRLLSRHPDAKSILKSGGLTLGATDHKAAQDAAMVMLDSVDEVTSQAIKKTLKTLKTNKNIELISSVLTLVASGGVVGSILSFDEKYLAAVLGAIGFLSSLFPLLAKWLKTGVAGDVNLGDAFSKLSAYSWDARMLKAELARSTSQKKVNEIITQSNELAREIYLILASLGYHPDLRPL